MQVATESAPWPPYASGDRIETGRVARNQRLFREPGILVDVLRGGRDLRRQTADEYVAVGTAPLSTEVNGAHPRIPSTSRRDRLARRSPPNLDPQGAGVVASLPPRRCGASRGRAAPRITRKQTT
jgi:hypothetical protein